MTENEAELSNEEEPDMQWLADKINTMSPDAKRRLFDLIGLDPDIQESIRKAESGEHKY